MNAKTKEIMEVDRCDGASCQKITIKQYIKAYFTQQPLYCV